MGMIGHGKINCNNCGAEIEGTWDIENNKYSLENGNVEQLAIKSDLSMEIICKCKKCNAKNKITLK